MILHLGSDCIVPLKEVIAIFDAEAMSKSKDMKAYIENKLEKECFFCCKKEEIKTYVLTRKKEKDLIYASAISSQTLYKRTNLNNAIKSW